MNKKTLIIIISIILAAVIFCWFALNNIYFSYYTENLGVGGKYCTDGKLNNHLDEITTKNIGSIFCTKYSNSKYSVSCKGDIPMIVCKATIFQIYFSK
jgi:hypothetical protein